MPKTIPMSVRVSPEDAEFISRLEIGDAITPSDKIRALLQESRKRQEGFRDLAGCVAMVSEMLAPVSTQLLELESQERIHSELVLKLKQWIPETTGFLLTHLARRSDLDPRDSLEELERQLADRIFLLIEDVFRMGVTRECRGYDPAVIRDRIAPVLELAELIRSNE